jgi:metal-responsive CopG/Arc/MetJ family transcriptional regulator|tara:strand:+ start:493 stop:636 length:144 start_codon:yes stop_codon:yes gene_type:complete
MAKSRYVNFYLPETIVQGIDSIAEKEERSRNFIIKKILEKHLGKIGK